MSKYVWNFRKDVQDVSKRIYSVAWRSEGVIQMGQRKLFGKSEGASQWQGSSAGADKENTATLGHT